MIMEQKLTSLRKLQCVLTLTVAVLLTATHTTTGFMQQPAPHRHLSTSLQDYTRISSSSSSGFSSTALNVWFAGPDTKQDDVVIRIEKTSGNSRRIAGDIIIPRPIDDVWAILTDYDNLAIHVPNLVESKRVNPNLNSNFDSNGQQGDGTYQCTLYQKGAQKIAGFEFGASVTMDMTEEITIRNQECVKRILFKCVDSQFFSVFDGEWKVSSTIDPENPTKLASLVEYVVDVRPRGPVPVQALEWRIREDVPTNLRAVKAASIEVGMGGVKVLQDSQRKRKGDKAVNETISTPPRRPLSSARLSFLQNFKVKS